MRIIMDEFHYLQRGNYLKITRDILQSHKDLYTILDDEIYLYESEFVTNYRIIKSLYDEVISDDSFQMNVPFYYMAYDAEFDTISEILSYLEQQSYKRVKERKT